MVAKDRGATSPLRRLVLLEERFPDRPVFDTALSHALLRRVASGAKGESLRLYRPGKALLFSSLDLRRPGFRRAAELALAKGFAPVIRLAGGRAAAFLEESVAFAWAIHDPDARLRIRSRFEEISDWIVRALRRLGLDARIGAVAGEYCPGEFSVNLGGRTKVMGVGQRVIRGGAHVGGVVTVGQTEELRAVLVPVYEALGFGFDATTAGGIADADPGLSSGDFIEAMGGILREKGFLLEEGLFDASIHVEARALEPVHSPTGNRVGGSGNLPVR